MKGVYGLYTKSAMRTLVVGIVFRLGSIKVIVFVVVVVNVIWLALVLLVHPGASMANICIILINDMSTTGPPGKDLIKPLDATAGALGIEPTTRVKIATRTQ